MVSDDILDDALTCIRSTEPLTYCVVRDVACGDWYADVKLELSAAPHHGIYTMFENCKAAARDHDADGYTLAPAEDHHTDADGTPCFYISVEQMD